MVTKSFENDMTVDPQVHLQIFLIHMEVHLQACRFRLAEYRPFYEEL